MSTKNKLFHERHERRRPVPPLPLPEQSPRSLFRSHSDSSTAPFFQRGGAALEDENGGGYLPLEVSVKCEEASWERSSNVYAIEEDEETDWECPLGDNQGDDLFTSPYSNMLPKVFVDCEGTLWMSCEEKAIKQERIVPESPLIECYSHQRFLAWDGYAIKQERIDCECPPGECQCYKRYLASSSSSTCSNLLAGISTYGEEAQKMDLDEYDVEQEEQYCDECAPGECQCYALFKAFCDQLGGAAAAAGCHCPPDFCRCDPLWAFAEPVILI